MPCWTIRRYSAKFLARNVDLLKAAMDQLKWKYREVSAGIFEVRGMVIDTNTQNVDYRDADLANRLRQKYSTVALEAAAKKTKWYAKKKAANKYQLRRY